MILIFILFCLHFILISICIFIYLFFGHEETDPHLFGRKINRILKRGDFIFRGTAHILLPCGDRLQEGKKRKKGKKGEKEVGFSFSARWFLFEKGTGSTHEREIFFKKERHALEETV